MGMSCMKSCSSNPYSKTDSNPNPKVFEILDEYYKNNYLVLVVKYPHCTNFEGIKVMLYMGFKSSTELLAHNKGKLDPHFQENVGAPVARFTPTEASLPLIQAIISLSNN